ncbi:DUF4190 and DUF4352 domain-containing protein [Streptomyces sp. ISL-44]|uniref:DUF4190 domain-containing protein n=1 Tax=Streptomyces sp. ISL-44 TaxID=2819184 RepID=UPI001BE52EB3|nr:DUF4190 domain-containing protein [Streptomyces sp. ISL-44]MBT2540393.1 DUF4190 and DUF4352 domain-containing protein [Streptomyces sp. ISL-44]
MSTPPNPPSTPNGPPTEPAGTPIPEAAPVTGPPAQAPAPTQPPSLEKNPSPEEPSPEEPSPAQNPFTQNPFAPPSPDAPAPPARPTGPAAGPGFGPGGPGGPGNPWAQPGPGFGGVPYQGYPQVAPATNGLAVAALVVGIVGILLGLVPFFFWAGAILAATALGLGIGALVRSSNGAPRKAMAVTGTVLGVLGLGAAVGGVFLTALVVEKAADRAGRGLDRHERELIPYPDSSPTFSPKPWPKPSPTPSKVPGLTSALPFGGTFTYDNGVKVSLSAPKKYQPKGIIARERVKNAIQITVTITNGSTEPHEVIYAVPNVRDDKGMTAEMVFDSGGTGGGVPKMIRGSILPGESASGVVAFEVPEGTSSISADISAGTRLADVKYAGPVA